ncbi:uncharacterized protein [Choristoneura fumiferana]|uniref:uncharacterized protein n=1 Tax=Choristoneura fumiferana TaxID=7141 RepID=UPI003D1590BC
MPVECLLNNYMENEFRVAYRSLNFIDKLFLCPKFNITNSFITPTTKITNILIVFGAILQISMHVFRFCYMNNVFKNRSKGFAVTLTLFINQAMFVTITIFHYGNIIIQSKNSVLLMIKLQQIFRLVDLEKAKILNNHRNWNMISVFFMCLIYFIYTYARIHMAFIRHIYEDMAHGMMLIIISLMLILPPMIFDMNIIYMTRTIYLISGMLASWKNKMVANDVEIAHKYEVTHDSKSIKSLYSVYTKLIGAFCLCKNIFQVSVSE